MFPLAIYLCSEEEPETSMALAPFLLEQERPSMVSRSSGLVFFVVVFVLYGFSQEHSPVLLLFLMKWMFFIK